MRVIATTAPTKRSLRASIALFAALVAALVIGGVGCAHGLARRGSIDDGSRGSPSAGWLAYGVRLPDHGPGFETLRSEREGGLHWGTSRLVAMVTRSARASVRAGETPLRIGDLSVLRGGKVQRHHSHRNGRDVDLLFFTRDAATSLPVIAPGFVRYNRLGESIGADTPLRFDVARNWTLVEALLRDDSVAVSRVFVAAWLKRLVLEHARSEGRPAWVIARADRVLAQPGDSFAHDDHFHVRVACTPAERVRGCIDGGPLWHWQEKDWEKDDSETADDETVLAWMEPLPPGILHGPPTPAASVSVSEEPLVCVAPLTPRRGW